METPRKFITAKLLIRKLGSSSVLINYVLMNIRVSLPIESFAMVNLSGASQNYTLIDNHHANVEGIS